MQRLMIIVTFLILLSSFVAADDAGTLPDSPFYWLDMLGENIAHFFALTAEKEAELKLKHANERLAEANELIATNYNNKGTDVTVPMEHSTDLSPGDMSNRSDQMIQEAKAMLNRVLELQRMARTQNDVVRLNCVNDYLTQVKGLLRIMEASRADLLEAIRDGDERLRYHKYSQIAIAYENIARLRDQAEQCLGEELIFLGPTEVEVDLPTDIPVETPGAFLPTERPDFYDEETDGVDEETAEYIEELINEFIETISEYLEYLEKVDDVDKLEKGVDETFSQLEVLDSFEVFVPEVDDEVLTAKEKAAEAHIKAVDKFKETDPVKGEKVASEYGEKSDDRLKGEYQSNFGVCENGLRYNGVCVNGLQANGACENGYSLNGRCFNGAFRNGEFSNGGFYNIHWCNIQWENLEWCNVQFSNLEWSNVQWSNVNWCNINWENVKWCDAKFGDEKEDAPPTPVPWTPDVKWDSSGSMEEPKVHYSESDVLDKLHKHYRDEIEWDEDESVYNELRELLEIQEESRENADDIEKLKEIAEEMALDIALEQIEDIDGDSHLDDRDYQTLDEVLEKLHDVDGEFDEKDIKYVEELKDKYLEPDEIIDFTGETPIKIDPETGDVEDIDADEHYDEDDFDDDIDEPVEDPYDEPNDWEEVEDDEGDAWDEPNPSDDPEPVPPEEPPEDPIDDLYGDDPEPAEPPEEPEPEPVDDPFCEEVCEMDETCMMSCMTPEECEACEVCEEVCY